MPYQFPPDVDRLVRDQMTAGGYTSEDELLRAALRALDERNHALVEEDPEVVHGVRRGLDQMKQGLGRPFEDFDAEFRAAPKAS